MGLFRKLDDLKKLVDFAEKKKIFVGWKCWLSTLTKANNIDQQQSKRARLIQIIKIKKKISKTGSISWKINYFDDVTKRTSSRAVKFTEAGNITTTNFSICITKEKAIAMHDRMLKELETQYELNLKKALRKIKEFREEGN